MQDLHIGGPSDPGHALLQNGDVGPSGLPVGTLSIYGGSAGGDHHRATSPGQMSEGAVQQDAAAAAVGRGFHLGDMPPCDSMDTASKTALWSGKVGGCGLNSEDGAFQHSLEFL